VSCGLVLAVFFGGAVFVPRGSVARAKRLNSCETGGTLGRVRAAACPTGYGAPRASHRR
jgi:hypothetical protein